MIANGFERFPGKPNMSQFGFKTQLFLDPPATTYILRLFPMPPHAALPGVKVYSLQARVTN